MILSKSGRLNTEQTLICYKIYYINPFINKATSNSQFKTNLSQLEVTSYFLSKKLE